MNHSCDPVDGSRSSTTAASTDVRSCTREELQPIFKQWGEPAYRIDQLLQWLYRQRAAHWTEMTNLPLPLRQQLEQRFTCGGLELCAVTNAPDHTHKFLWRLSDRSLIETVLIPANPALYGEPSDRLSLCVSTQVGCAYGCKFCASGLEGWKRNLEPCEIVNQVIAAEKWLASKAAESLGDTAGTRGERRVDNLVVMGMGEPLANYDRLLKALQIINASWGLGIGARKITISTSGLAPQIRQLALEPYQFRLAVSLHAGSDDIRNRIMPVNRKYPLAELLAACRDYLRAKGRMITLEYILIAGVNDALPQADQLIQVARPLHARINLIPYNPVAGLSWERPSEGAQEAFLARLKAKGLTATLRREKGLGIDAACGQLRLRTEHMSRNVVAFPAANQ
jgi:23S rRNA (adenine2503-C2)-methyltransferase